MKSSRPWYANPWLQAGFVLLVAVLFRFWRLHALPPGLFGDEAQDGLDALDVLAGRGAVFFPANFGREGLHMWIVAGMFRIFGVTPLALRLPSALAGSATALAAYWLGRELLASTTRRGERGHPVAAFIPLFAALYLATSFWHVHFSRFGIRGVFTPLFGALAFAAFWRAVNRRSSAWFALSGAFLGLAAHFYTASRFFPIFLGGYLLAQWGIAALMRAPERAILPRNLRGIVVLFAVAALVFAPLGLYFAAHPGAFTQRASEVAAFGGDNAWVTMGRAGLANIRQFVIPGSGDVDRFYNLPGRAVFEPLTALLALLGLVLLAIRWRRGEALFLLLWFPALLLPSFLATDRWPTLPRVLGVIPGVYFFPAVGLAGLAAFLVWLGKRVRLEFAGRVVAVAAAVLALGAHAATTYRDYFRIWGPSAATFDAFEGDMTAAWRWLEQHPTADHVYLSSDIYLHPTFTLLRDHATVQTYFERLDPALSWFDARDALPLPPPHETALYLLTTPSSLPAAQDAWLRGAGRVIDTAPAPDGQPALTVIELNRDDAAMAPGQGLREARVAVSDRLTLTGAGIDNGEDGALRLALRWETGGPDPGGYPAYRLELKTEGAPAWQTALPFEGFRPPEWVAGGEFFTWHRLEGLTAAPSALSLRLVDLRDGQPLTGEAAPDGWLRLPVH